MQSTLKTLCLGLVATGSLLAASVTMAADGASLYTSKQCDTCHGADANTPVADTFSPKLAGQNEVYLTQQIKDIRDGKRTNGKTADMKKKMDEISVSDKEAMALAKWIASQTAKSESATANGASVYTGKMCNTCHGADANSPITGSYPKLAGQDAVYLAQQIKDIRDGKRTNGMSASMKAMMGAFKVSDDEATTLGKWAASQAQK
ncbi:c-type cytochrome [Candidatus Parabeggiatoa sp. HSG14]|uniref:c-type cytochrome n=1 Tax=Candidatus Parabeggiatoa sp. HSG14 TaxID=3055593 RepID=UPI0025A79DEA|nr:c-type cytochrome [Thiotrichales bacterium HSG14]